MATNPHRSCAIMVKRTTNALDVIRRYGQTDGAQHKAWCIDQVVRQLLGGDSDEYRAFVTACKANGMPYDIGIAPGACETLFPSKVKP